MTEVFFVGSILVSSPAAMYIWERQRVWRQSRLLFTRPRGIAASTVTAAQSTAASDKATCVICLRCIRTLHCQKIHNELKSTRSALKGAGTNSKFGGHMICPVRSAGQYFAPPLFLALIRVQSVVLVSAFVMGSTVRSVSCLLFFYSRCPHAVARSQRGVGAHRGPKPPPKP